MLHIIAGLALVGAGIWIYNELESESSAQRERWRSKRDEVQRSLEWHKQQIETHLADAQRSFDFKVLVDMHYSCVKVADQAYALLQDARTSLDKIGEAIVKTKEEREKLFERKKQASGEERLAIQEEINSIQSLRKKLFDDKDEIKSQRDEFLSRVKELNSKTHSLKISIRDRTGTRGREWYQRLEARKRARA